jgi:regulator of sigma E protease
MTTVLLFLVVIVFLVVAHEFGHFLTAKAFGVKIDEFGIGYPPRAKKLFTWKGTLFSLNWLPFGGFVKIAGEEEGMDGTGSAPSAKESFAQQKMWKRVAIIVAGIVANMIIAILLYTASFSAGFLASPGSFPGSVQLGATQAMIIDIVPGSPASKAGFLGGDMIRELSTPTEKLIPTSVESAIDFIHRHGTEAIAISLVRSGNTKDITVTPALSKPGALPMIGINLAEVAEVRLPFLRAVTEGTSYTFREFGTTITTLGSLVSGLFRGDHTLVGQVSGPVGIAKFAGQAYSLGLGSFLSFMALISVNLAVINILPFPALDGGRIIMELFAQKGRSKIPKKAVAVVNQVGFFILIAIMLFVTYHDIQRLFV